MKKIISAALSLLFLLLCVPQNTFAADYQLVSKTLVLLDADTGEVLLSRNRNQKMYPASITKILTGLLAVENCAMQDTVTVNASAVGIPRGYAHIGLAAGDQITVEQAMYSMMLPSANDAANALAEHIGGSQKQFAAIMNERAKELGAKNSNFVNASGMPDPRHYTTAMDMALITREAIRSKTFRGYFGAKSYLLPAVNRNTKPVELSSYQFMLLEDKDEYYPYATGGKIGYTGESGHTMVTVATRNGKTLICVVLGSSRDGKYEDTSRLLDYGFTLAS